MIYINGHAAKMCDTLLRGSLWLRMCRQLHVNAKYYVFRPTVGEVTDLKNIFINKDGWGHL